VLLTAALARCRDTDGATVSAEQGSGRRRSTSLDVQASQGSGRAVHSLRPLVDDRLGGVCPEMPIATQSWRFMAMDAALGVLEPLAVDCRIALPAILDIVGS